MGTEPEEIEQAPQESINLAGACLPASRSHSVAARRELFMPVQTYFEGRGGVRDAHCGLRQLVLLGCSAHRSTERLHQHRLRQHSRISDCYSGSLMLGRPTQGFIKSIQPHRARHQAALQDQ